MILIKIGGGGSINIPGIIADLAELDEPFVLLHGANALRDELAEQLGKPKKVITSISGYSSVFSDQTALEIMMMAYAGLKNKRIVELCQQHGINAVGLSGLDGQMIRGRRNRGIRVEENGRRRILRDFSGKPESVNTGLLELLLRNGYTPVLCVPILDENNIAINSENDDILNVLQKSLHADKIIQFIEAPGFLDNADDPDSLVARITPEELAQREAQVTGRMKRKMLALRRLFEGGAGEVIISDGRVEHPLREALSGKGTVIK